MTDNIRFLIGVDGGGTHCRAVIALPDGTELARAKSGSANIASDVETTSRNILEAVTCAAANAGLDNTVLAHARACLGLAGASSSASNSNVIAQLPFAQTHITTDAGIALQGALDIHDGAIAILGTGSSFLSRKNGVLRLIGGWGFQLSDHGGGARLGREALEMALLAHDGMVMHTPLTKDLIGQFANGARALGVFSRTATAADFGTFAPTIVKHLECGDRHAIVLFQRTAAFIDAAFDALELKKDDQIALIGGLAHAYPNYLAQRHVDRLVPPRADALTGAIALAMKLGRGETTQTGEQEAAGNMGRQGLDAKD